MVGGYFFNDAELLRQILEDIDKEKKLEISSIIKKYKNENDVIWFHLKDLCDSLGIVNSRQIAKVVNHRKKGTVCQKYAIDAIGRKRLTHWIF